MVASQGNRRVQEERGDNMSLREEQCRKVCRILDDVLGNRPTERDSLIVATRSAFRALSEPHWIPCSERLPEYGEEVLSITQDDVYEVNHVIDDVHGEWFWEDNENVIAWMPLPEPFKGATT